MLQATEIADRCYPKDIDMIVDEPASKVGWEGSDWEYLVEGLGTKTKLPTRGPLENVNCDALLWRLPASRFGAPTSIGNLAWRELSLKWNVLYNRQLGRKSE